MIEVCSKSVEELERLRKKAVNVVLIGGLCLVVILVCVIIFFPFLFAAPLLFILSGIGLSIIVKVSAKSRKEFILAFKKSLVLNSLKLVFTDVNYEPEKGIDENVIKDAQMIRMGDSYTSSNYVSVKYKNVVIEQVDLLIEDTNLVTDDERLTRTAIFKGRWMIFDLNKNFKGKMQITQKMFGRQIVLNSGVLGYKKIMVDDQEFKNKFRVYAQDEQEALEILTPLFIEKIKKLSNFINNKISLCFIDNKLHVGVQNSKTSFEHSIFKKIDETKVTEEICKDIRLITNFVDELDLNNDLFRKNDKVIRD